MNKREQEKIRERGYTMALARVETAQGALFATRFIGVAREDKEITLRLDKINGQFEDLNAALRKRVGI